MGYKSMPLSLRNTLLVALFIFIYTSEAALRDCSDVGTFSIDEITDQRKAVFDSRSNCEKNGFWLQECSNFYSNEATLYDYQFKELCQQEEFVYDISDSLGIGDEAVPYLAEILDTIATIKKDVEGTDTLQSRLLRKVEELNAAASIVDMVSTTIVTESCTNEAQATFVSDFQNSVTATSEGVVVDNSKYQALLDSLAPQNVNLETNLNNKANNSNSDLTSLINTVKSVQNGRTSLPTVDLALTTACQSEIHPVLKAILPSSSNHRGFAADFDGLLDDALTLYNSKSFDTSQETQQRTAATGDRISVSKTFCSIYTSIE